MTECSILKVALPLLSSLVPVKVSLTAHVSSSSEIHFCVHNRMILG